MPSLPPKDERFNREVAFIEATTESISQFTLGNVIVRIFGISDDPTSKALQYFSLATSSLSLSLAFVTVSIPVTLESLESFVFKFSQFEKIYLPFFMGNDFLTEICKILLTLEKRAFSATGGN